MLDKRPSVMTITHPDTCSAMQARNNAPSCHICGRAIPAAPFALEEDRFCCEACFLKQREQRDLQAERDSAYLALAEALAAALDAREHETGLHSQRVACHTQVLARRFTRDPQRLRQIYWGALLHDIGKIGIPDAILLKQGPLTEHEWVVMRTHPEIGHHILASVPFMDEAAELVLCHEELTQCQNGVRQFDIAQRSGSCRNRSQNAQHELDQPILRIRHPGDKSRLTHQP